MLDRHSLEDRHSSAQTCWRSLQARLFPRWSQMETIRADSLGLTWDLAQADMTRVERSAQRLLDLPADSVLVLADRAGPSADIARLIQLIQWPGTATVTRRIQKWLNAAGHFSHNSDFN